MRGPPDTDFAVVRAGPADNDQEIYFFAQKRNEPERRFSKCIPTTDAEWQARNKSARSNEEFGARKVFLLVRFIVFDSLCAITAGRWGVMDRMILVWMVE
jgi:hypothetical protein